MQIAFVNQSRHVQVRDFAFRVAAVDLGMQQHFMGAWAGHLDGADQSYWPVVDYGTMPSVSNRLLHPIFEMDSIGDPNADGFHDDEADFVYGRTLAPSSPTDATTEDHEAKEMRGDPGCNLWWRMPDGREVAAEVGDPVEGDSYPCPVTIAGETRTIELSNFILPAWRIPSSPGPWDFLGKLRGPFSMTAGGYMIIRDPRTGSVSNLFADDLENLARHTASDRLKHISMARLQRACVRYKLADRHSRIARRFVGQRAQSGVSTASGS